MKQTFKTDTLNIVIYEVEELFKDRDLDREEMKSDFDEIHGLGEPSIDSYTMKEVNIESPREQDADKSAELDWEKAFLTDRTHDKEKNNNSNN